MRDDDVDIAEEQALLGTWSVQRRDGIGDSRFLQIRFFADHRFATLAVDGRSRAYGYWTRNSVSAGSNAKSSQIELHFDQHTPSVRYRIDAIDVAFETMTLTDLPDAHVKLVLARPFPIEATLIGTWTAPSRLVERGTYAIEQLKLERDGGASIRLTGGVVRLGRWEFSRDRNISIRAINGTLIFDSTDIVFPVRRWPAHLLDAGTLHLTLTETPTAAFSTVTLTRRTLDPSIRHFVGTWRLVESASTSIGLREITISTDGSMEILTSSGSPRVRGEWALVKYQRGAAEVTAVFNVIIRAPGHPARSEQWNVAIEFVRGSELRVADIHSDRANRYRRLFR